MTTKVHAVVKVDSKQRQTISPSNTDFSYFIQTPINFYKRSPLKQYFVRLENVKIPMSFYNVNDNYDTINWTEFDGAIIFGITTTIPHGNYTIDELASQISVSMTADSNYGTTYTMLYDDIKQKMTIVGVGGTATEVNFTGGNLLPMIGVNQPQITGYPIASTITIGDGAAYSSNWRYLKLFIDNMNSNNIYNSTGIQRIGLEVPVNEFRNSFIYFDNHDGYLSKMNNMSVINSFNVKLTDFNNNVIDLQKVPWSFDVVFYELTLAKETMNPNV